jgi:alkylhydroperoxidase family enzyme
VSRRLGISEDQLHDLTRFESSPHFSAQEKLVLELATALTHTPADVSDELFVRLRDEFSDLQLVELSSAVAWENYRARFNRTFAIDAEGFSHGQFCPLPER